MPPQDQLTSTPGPEQVTFVVTPPDQNGQSDSSNNDTPPSEKKSDIVTKETEVAKETTVAEGNEVDDKDVPDSTPNESNVIPLTMTCPLQRW